MKKIMFKGMALLTMGFAFAACSKSDVFEENKANIVADQKSEYRTNFEAKYGKVDPNQSWDFSGFSSTTRAGESVTLTNIKDPESFQTYLHTDKDGLKNETTGIKGVAEKNWDPYVSVNLYPAFCSDESKKNCYFRIVVNYNGKQTPISTIQIKNNSWWNSQATAPSQSGKGINTMNLKSAENVSWAVQYLSKKGCSTKDSHY